MKAVPHLPALSPLILLRMASWLPYNNRSGTARLGQPSLHKPNTGDKPRRYSFLSLRKPRNQEKDGLPHIRTAVLSLPLDSWFPYNTIVDKPNFGLPA